MQRAVLGGTNDWALRTFGSGAQFVFRARLDFEDGVRYMRVVKAVADSRARNEWVEIKR